MNTDLFIENSFALSTRPVLRAITDVMEFGDLMNKKPHPDIDFVFGDVMDPDEIFISVRGAEPQRFVLEFEKVTYGERAYFRCECGSRVTKLYLPPHGSKLKCRKCHNLKYQLSTINKNSVAGKKLYQMTQAQRLINKRTRINRIFYGGEYTKRFSRFLTQCEKAGFDTVLHGAAMMKVLLSE